ncbi:hypothetical protein Lepto7375DRAFT_7924 [Leptolyngbya sp. PCC 7375]|nr:hypothetical protein Lepto7375DRAFT_7924 [Leptolyngbya sp. PCC 7375]
MIAPSVPSAGDRGQARGIAPTEFWYLAMIMGEFWITCLLLGHDYHIRSRQT